MSTSDTIKDLVKQRSLTARTAEEVEAAMSNPLTQHRNIEVIRTEEIYLFNMSVITGSGKISIDCGNKLKLNPSLSEAVTEQEGSYLIHLPVFKGLSKRGTKLSSRRASIQDKFLRYARPYWYVSKPDMPALRDELVGSPEMKDENRLGLFEMVEDLRGEVLEMFDDSHTEFLVGLEKIFNRSGLDSTEVSKLLIEYDAYFPTQERIKHDFGVILEGPIRIPSLLEEANRNADIAEALAREEAADLAAMRTELERQTVSQEQRALDRQEQAVKDLERYWIESIQSSFAQGIQDAQDEGYLFMAQMLERMESIEPDALTNRARQYFNSKARELQSCLNTLNSVLVNGEHPDPLLARFAEYTRQLKVLTSTSVDKSRLQTRLNTLREQMRDELANVVSISQSKGHRAIAKWMILPEEERTAASDTPALLPASRKIILDDAQESNNVA